MTTACHTNGELLDGALAYASRGWRVHPLHNPTDVGVCSCPEGQRCGKKCGKHPRLTGWTEKATTDPKQVRAWWAESPRANVGFAPGAKSGVLVIDADDLPAFLKLAEQNGGLPLTPCSETGGGRHYFFKDPTGLGLKNWVRPDNLPFDIRTDGGNIVLPPSRHRDGGDYRWLVHPDDAPLADLPPWLAVLLATGGRKKAEAPPNGKATSGHAGKAKGASRPNVEARCRDYMAKVPIAVSGQGGHSRTLYAARAIFRGFDLSEDAGWPIFCDWCAKCDPPWSEKEMRHKVTEALTVDFNKPVGWLLNEGESDKPFVVHAWGASADQEQREQQADDAGDGGKDKDRQAGPAGDDDQKTTDLGNARRLVRRHGRNLRYCHPWSKWLVWDDRRWAVDDTGAAVRLAKDTVTALYREAACEAADVARQIAAVADGDDEANKQLQARLSRLKKLVAWAVKSESSARLNSMLDLAKSEPGIPVLPDQLDAHPWLLNCPNGTLDLKTGTLREHERGDLITALCPVEYDPEARAPLWVEKTEEIFQRKSGLIDYVQKSLGRTLTGDVTEQTAEVWHGNGANGKSVVINTVLDILGEDYGIKASSDLLLSHKQDTHPAALARLFGKRLVVACETPENARLDEGLVKELTGGDALQVRRMREDPWQFRPTFKLVLVTNHKPQVNGTDHGIWRRLRLVPFLATFAEAQQDKNLPEKLKAEAPGILAWLAEGCLRWQAEGLGLPEDVEKATAAYRSEQDVLGEFLAEHCNVDGQLSVRAGELYAAFKTWSEQAGERVLSQKRFGRALTERGFERYTNNGTRYRGLAMKPRSDADTDPTEGYGTFGP